MKNQQSLPSPTIGPVAALPEEFRGESEATYAKHRPKNRRDLCSICVWILHHDSAQRWPALVGVWTRKGHQPEHELEALAYLCGQHRQEWRERDVAAARPDPNRGRLPEEDHRLGHGTRVAGLPSTPGHQQQGALGDAPDG